MSNFTEDAIKRSFKKLLEIRQLKDITIRDIVDDCGINRSSFYYHFQDIPALLEDIVKEGTDAIIRKNAGKTIAECMEGVVEFFLENKKTVQHVYRAVSRETFEQWLDRAAKYFVQNFFSTALSDTEIPEETGKMLRQYYVYLTSGFLLKWIAKGLQEERARDFICLIHRLGEPGDLLKQLAAPKADEEQERE